MSGITHPYSDYVNHILNSSPSKMCFTFPKAERFLEPKPIDPPLPTDSLQPFDRYPVSSKQWNYPRVSPDNKFSNVLKEAEPERRRNLWDPPKVNEQMNRIVSNIDRERAERSKEKGTGNGKRDYGGMFEYVDRRYGAAYREYDSPKKRSQQRSPSKERRDDITASQKYPPPAQRNSLLRHTVIPRQGKQSPQRLNRTATYNQQLEQLNAPFKSISPAGYYPTGKELTNTGRYFISQIRNSPANDFGKSPSREKITSQLMRERTQVPGPGEYDPFSEFWPIKPVGEARILKSRK